MMHFAFKQKQSVAYKIGTQGTSNPIKYHHNMYELLSLPTKHLSVYMHINAEFDMLRFCT